MPHSQSLQPDWDQLNFCAMGNGQTAHLASLASKQLKNSAIGTFRDIQ